MIEVDFTNPKQDRIGQWSNIPAYTRIVKQGPDALLRLEFQRITAQAQQTQFHLELRCSPVAEFIDSVRELKPALKWC